jgi:hypothetical protein
MGLDVEQEPHFRLLVCRTCGTIDELPSGDEDPGDVLLDITVERHGEEHHGVLVNVPKGIWITESGRKQMIEFIHGQVGSGLDSFGTQFYETKNQFHEDAMACFSMHNRPKGQCSDYKSDKKELSPQTEQARRREGLPVKPRGKTVYLCDFCPVKAHNQRKAYGEAGLYN